MDTIEVNNKLKKIQGVQFKSEQSYQATKSALASSSYEGFKPDAQSVQKIRDVVEGRVSRQNLIDSLCPDVYD